MTSVFGECHTHSGLLSWLNGSERFALGASQWYHQEASTMYKGIVGYIPNARPDGARPEGGAQGTLLNSPSVCTTAVTHATQHCGNAAPA